MLFKRRVLDGIAERKIDLAFRRWRRPTVRSGGELRTAIGVLAIEAVDVVSAADITQRDAERAGYSSREELLVELRGGEGSIHRIELRLAGADPRIALRDDDRLSERDLATLKARLARLDAASRRGPWTRAVLELIRDRPATRAAELAASRGLETLAFKADVRKLKELGLTESLEVGYRLSPRGRAFLAALFGSEGSA